MNLRTKCLALAGAAIALAMGSILGGGNPQARAGTKPDAAQALPKKEELPDFDNYRVESDSGASITAASDVMTYRKGDRARLWIQVIIADTEDKAEQLVQQARVTQIGLMPPSTPSKLRIGQECYNSNRNPGLPVGSLKIIARDGRSVAIVQLMALGKKATPTTHGRAEIPTLSAQDVDLVEKHTLKVLDKLTKMGYTSKSAN